MNVTSTSYLKNELPAGYHAARHAGNAAQPGGITHGHGANTNGANISIIQRPPPQGIGGPSTPSSFRNMFGH